MGEDQTVERVPASVDRNAAAWDREVDAYAGETALQQPELAILRRFRGEWSRMSVLDLGVGAGRTAYTLAAMVPQYVGVDYSPRMINRAKAAVGDDERTDFHVGDARDLAFLGEQRFDFVLFSFNGIDYVGHDHRLRVLANVRELLTEKGWFAFSSHSLAALPLATKLRQPTLRTPLRSAWHLWRDIAQRRLDRRINRSYDAEQARVRGWAQLRDECQDVITYYIDPLEQRQQLAEAGFELVATYDLAGEEISVSAPGRDAWLYYLCRPANGTG